MCSTLAPGKVFGTNFGAEDNPDVYLCSALVLGKLVGTLTGPE